MAVLFAQAVAADPGAVAAGPGRGAYRPPNKLWKARGWRTIDAILAVLFARAVAAGVTGPAAAWGRSGQKVRPANKSENMKNMDAELASNSP